jgi:hypothetical protein
MKDAYSIFKVNRFSIIIAINEEAHPFLIICCTIDLLIFKITDTNQREDSS